MSFVDGLLKKLRIEPNDTTLYELALTHSSFNNKANTKHQDYERLEFLGDSLIGFVVGELSYKHHPEMLEGDLTKLRSQFIRTASEASYGRKLGLDKYLRTGESLQQTNDHLYEDIFESFIGAIYLDKGLDYAVDFVKTLMEEDIKSAKVLVEKDPKSTLQEKLQAETRETISYKTISESGPAHDKTFVMAVYLEDIELGRGVGHSKKEAESNAARDALSKMVGA
ncbi:MAG: ribonuclease III [Bacilli bacterium]|nr:ribonuclease III [Bacilli bacterium]